MLNKLNQSPDKLSKTVIVIEHIGYLDNDRDNEAEAQLRTRKQDNKSCQKC